LSIWQRKANRKAGAGCPEAATGFRRGSRRTPPCTAAAILATAICLLGRLPAADLPAPVLAGVSEIAPRALASDSTTFQSAGEDLYVVEVEIPGNPQKREWYFDAHGVPVGVQIFGHELPPALHKSLPAGLRQKDGVVPDAVKIFESGKPLFEFEKRGGGGSRSLGFHPDGHPAYSQTDASQLSKPIRRAVHRLIEAEGELESILQRPGRPGPSYQLALKQQGKPLWITLAPSGKVLHREETAGLENTPPQVQAALVAAGGTVGRARILRQLEAKTERFEARFFKQGSLHILIVSNTGKPIGPALTPLRLP
jgi:hypothetical protein